MNLERRIELLAGQVAAANKGHPGNFQEWKDKTEVVLRTVMGEQHPSLAKFRAIRYSPSVWIEGMDPQPYQVGGVQQVISLLNACQEELRLTAELEQMVTPAGDDESDAAKQRAAESGRVFIVHGHDEAAKHSVARLVDQLLGVQPVILHEQPSRGRVVLEKFEDYAGPSGYAVVLLTADDLGRAKPAEAEAYQPRGRQNVIFEMGFFAGALGRGRMAVLYDLGVEIPSDLGGLVYIERDSAGAWRTQVARELQAAGFMVDWSALGRLA